MWNGFVSINLEFKHPAERVVITDSENHCSMSEYVSFTE